METKHQYTGILTAVPTPFDERLRFFLEPLVRHIERLRAAGAGIVPLNHHT